MAWQEARRPGRSGVCGGGRERAQVTAAGPCFLGAAGSGPPGPAGLEQGGQRRGGAWVTVQPLTPHTPREGPGTHTSASPPELREDARFSWRGRGSVNSGGRTGLPPGKSRLHGAGRGSPGAGVHRRGGRKVRRAASLVTWEKIPK